jgi:excisionase family DNA binding protein
MHSTGEKLAFTIAEAVSSSGIGRTKLYALIKEGQLEARKLGSKTLIPAPSLRSLVDGLPRSAKTAA